MVQNSILDNRVEEVKQVGPYLKTWEQLIGTYKPYLTIILLQLGGLRLNLVNTTLSILQHIFVQSNFFSSKLPLYTTTTLDNATLRIFVLSFKQVINAKIPSSMLYTSKIHPFSLGNFTYHWELNDNQGHQCRLDMLRVYVACCLVCCLVLMVIQYHQCLCALSCILPVSNSIFYYHNMIKLQ